MTDDHRQTRREHLHSIGAAATFSIASLAPTTTPGLTGWSTPDDAVAHSNDRLSWIVSVEGADAAERAENLNALNDELERYDDAFQIDSRRHDAAGQTTLVAPPADIGVRQRDQLRNGGLQSLGYIDSIEVNRLVSIPDPIEPEGSEAWTSPGTLTSLLLSTLGDGPPEPDLVAFGDGMEHSYMRDAREATDADLDTLPGGSELAIAVVDTGVTDSAWLDDADGNTRLLPESTDFTSEDDPSGIGETTDHNGHGDWCASCYAASDPDDSRRDGYLPTATVLGCKAMGSDGQGSLSDISAAIRHAADESAAIINLSLGGPLFSQSIENALEYAVDQGSIPIAASGNDRQASRWISHPASSEHAIGVGSTTVAPPEEAKSAYYSNIGPHNGYSDDSAGATEGAELDIGAPGCELEAATGEALTGTSMAAPAAGGVVALYLADGGEQDLEHVRDRLQATARPVPMAAEEEVGHGMASAEHMIAGTEPEETQAESMTDEAETRGSAYRALSGSRYRRATARFR